mmetsp:Transcript_23680/g.48338  ORF Transcript_23680/g.48338 Transcript_23680/m.48338 type:complete len:470 (+) Transcript_23680:39-1448(+)
MASVSATLLLRRKFRHHSIQDVLTASSSSSTCCSVGTRSHHSVPRSISFLHDSSSRGVATTTYENCPYSSVSCVIASSSIIPVNEFHGSFRKRFITPSIIITRGISSTAIVSDRRNNNNSDDSRGYNGADLHSLYQEQMKEISEERISIFGRNDDDSRDSNGGGIHSSPASSTFEQYFSQHVAASSSSSQAPPLSRNDDGNDTPPTTLSNHGSSRNGPIMPPDWDMEEAQAEREALYQFTEEEKVAWGNHSGGGNSYSHSTANVDQAMFDRLMEQRDRQQATSQSSAQSTQSTPTSGFTHLSPQGDGVTMVDVGAKTTTRRVAMARSVVIFPPEVMKEFDIRGSGIGVDRGMVSKSEMVGPKGPIFETARLAGIMGAKRTSELIPLCHPLPLDKVHIDIQLVGNHAIIECECRVTHKTGVEMEALMGASIAALTIYDMVKAVSHRVEIGKTILVNKSGGKRNVVGGNEQ